MELIGFMDKMKGAGINQYFYMNPIAKWVSDFNSSDKAEVLYKKS